MLALAGYGIVQPRFNRSVGVVDLLAREKVSFCDEEYLSCQGFISVCELKKEYYFCVFPFIFIFIRSVKGSHFNVCESVFLSRSKSRAEC